MKNLVEVTLRVVQDKANYIVSVNETFDGLTICLLKGSGKEVLEFMKDRIGFDEDKDEDLFTWFNKNNGSKFDLISIFEV